MTEQFIVRYPEKPCKKVYGRAKAVENSLNEIDSHISYLKDIKREELIPYEELIGELDKRLKKMKKSPNERQFKSNNQLMHVIL